MTKEVVYDESPITDRYRLKQQREKEMRYKLAKAIIELVLEHRGQSLSKVIRKSRKWEYVYTRFLCYYFIRAYTHPKVNLSEIGDMFERDHTTIVNGVQAIEDLLYTDEKVVAEVDIISGKIEKLKRSLRIQR